MHMTIPNAIERLARDHINARRVLNTLEQQIESVAQYQGCDMEVIAGVIAFFAENGGHHTVEAMIFNILRKRAPHKLEELDTVAAEHDASKEKLDVFAEAARLARRDLDAHRHAFCRAARAFITMERKHIQKEEARFFRYAIEYLTAHDWMIIEWGISDADSNASAEAGTPRLVLKSA
jgi:hemerythrin-like domain-containing protein